MITKPLLALLFALTLLLADATEAAGPQALAGRSSTDARLGPKKDLNGYFPFTPPETAEAWNARAEQLRRQILVSQGLWPRPTATPANAVVHSRVEREGYTVEKVYFESFPGHFVTGNLYRPTGHTGRRPGVLCPHGHWANGRFYDHGVEGVKQQIAKGAEQFEQGGRYPLQARCVGLARLGCVVFHYDMIGYADSVQLEHRPGVRAHMNTPENWGFFSPQAELRLQTMMSLQTYNSLCALDWLSSLEDVDPAKVGVTGASGGATQTLVLCAVDQRPAAAFPAVMVSTAMQGGCSCENSHYLRIGTGNVEIAGLFAPKPLGLTSADDWTKELETKGLPELKRLYEVLGAPQHLTAALLTQFEHNYNSPSRKAMYQLFNHHLLGGPNEPVEERDFQPLTIEEMTVWDAAHPKPAGGDDYERWLLKWMTEDSAKQLAELAPSDDAKLARFREVVGGAWQVMIGRELPPAGAITGEVVSETDRGTHVERVLLLKNAALSEELPAVGLIPKTSKGQSVIWLDPRGKRGLYEDSGAPIAPVQALLEAGLAVYGVDLLYQGEFRQEETPLERISMVKVYDGPWAEYAAYTYGYNHPLFSQRVHDVLSMIRYATDQQAASTAAGAIEHTEAAGASAGAAAHLVGIAGTGHYAAGAAFIAGQAVDRLAIDTAGFRFESLTAVDQADFLPGSVKYGDLPSLLALAGERPLWVAGEAEAPAIVAQSQASAKRGTLQLAAGEEASPNKAAAWIMAP